MMEAHLVSLLCLAFLPLHFHFHTQRSSSTGGSWGQAQEKAWGSQHS